MSAPLTWSSRSAHPTAARLSFRPSKLHLVVESTNGKNVGLFKDGRVVIINEVGDGAIIEVILGTDGANELDEGVLPDNHGLQEGDSFKWIPQGMGAAKIISINGVDVND